jgi:hypothetical protein
MSVRQFDMRSIHSMEERFVPPQPGGVYVTQDGREPTELSFRLSPDVRKLLGKAFSRGEVAGLQEAGALLQTAGSSDKRFIPLEVRFAHDECQLNAYDVNSCLERLSITCSAKDRHQVATAIKGVCEIFDRVVAELEQFPAHPRLFRFGEFFPSKGIIKLVLDAAEQTATSDGAGEALKSKLCYSYEWKGAFPQKNPADESHAEDAGKSALGNQATTELNAPCKTVVKRDGSVWRVPAISLSDVKQAFTWVVSVAQKGEGSHATGESVLFLCHAVQDVLSKLGMMTGDGYERVPGTRLFTKLEKAISRVMIEHALLTSSPDELLESARAGALMVAIGGGVLTMDNLDALGVRAADDAHDADGNSYGMEHDRQVQSGLRILRLIRQLSNSDEALQGVLKVYSRQEFSISGAFAGLADSCAKVWQLRDLLDLPVWAVRPEGFQELQNHLAQIISNGRADISEDGKEILWKSAPSASSAAAS